jgi:hypothetical protein
MVVVPLRCGSDTYLTQPTRPWPTSYHQAKPPTEATRTDIEAVRKDVIAGLVFIMSFDHAKNDRIDELIDIGLDAIEPPSLPDRGELLDETFHPLFYDHEITLRSILKRNRRMTKEAKKDLWKIAPILRTLKRRRAA